jgi:hypothetical protein
MQVSFIQKSIVVAFGAVALLGATAGAGHAWSLTELQTAIPGRVDAGQIPGTAGVLDPFDVGQNVLRGGLSFDNGGADLYKFSISQAGTFTASTFGRGANPLGYAQLFLFNDIGGGLAGNNPSGPVATISKILAVGTYYIGISSSSLDPRTVVGTRPNGRPIYDYIFDSTDTNVNNFGALANWDDRTGETKRNGGTYGINLSFAATPVPTPAMLPGLAALGFNAIRKRKAKAAVA